MFRWFLYQASCLRVSLISVFQAESFRLYGVSELGGCQVLGFEVWFGLPGLIGVQEDDPEMAARIS